MHPDSHEKKTATPSMGTWLKSHWIEAILLLVSVAVLVLFAVLLYQKVTGEKQISRYLPAENTIAVLTVKTDRQSADWQALNEMFLATGSGSVIEQSLGIKEAVFQTSIVPWLGNTGGFALVTTPQERVQPALFLSFTDESTMLHSLQTMAKQTGDPVSQMYQADRIFTFGEPPAMYASIVQKYVVLARERSVIESVLDAYRGRKDSLYQNEAYINLQKNLPPSDLANLYVDYPRAIHWLKKSLADRKEYRDLFTLLRPLENDIAAWGVSLSYRDSGGVRGWYLKTSVFGSAQLFTPLSTLTNNAGSLDQVVGETTRGYLGGFKFLAGVNGILQYFSQNAPDSEVVLEGIINQYLHRYLATNTSLRQLLNFNGGEYGIFWKTVPETNEQGLLAIFHISNEFETEQLLASIWPDFQSNSEFLYTPQIRELPLPDGTVGKELYLNPRAVTAHDDPLQGATVHYLILQNDPFSPGYVLLDGKLYLFSHYALLQEYFQQGQRSQDSFHALRSLIHFQGHMRGFWENGPVSEKSEMTWMEKFSQPVRAGVFSLEFLPRSIALEQFWEIQ